MVYEYDVRCEKCGLDGHLRVGRMRGTFNLSMLYS